MVATDGRCLSDPVPEILVGELGDSTVNLNCGAWGATDDYWTIYSGFKGAVKVRFD